MPTTVIPNIALELTVTIDGAPVAFECQTIDASFALPGSQPGETTEVACPDGKVSEPGSTTNGSLTGTVFTDTTATGITWALMNAYQAGEEFDYSFTWFADQPATHAVLFTGRAKVNTFSMDWAKPGNAKHPLDLALITCAIARPTPLAV
jgi:hypothetical protein